MISLRFSHFSSSIGRLSSGFMVRSISTTPSLEAARKGTREKARKKKIKVEVQKIGFIPHNLRKKKVEMGKRNLHIDDSNKSLPIDDVWCRKYHRMKVYSIAEAIQAHRETHHPTLYNVPNAPLNVDVELYSQGIKKTRFVDNFSRIAPIPFPFDHGEKRSVMCFTKTKELADEAMAAGATMAGATELIKQIQGGKIDLAEYDYFVAHPNVLPDLVQIRGLIRRAKFPTPKDGTVDVNLKEMIQKFLNGIRYQMVKNDEQKDFGLIQTCIGPLDMEAQHLEENLIALIKNVEEMRPKREGKWITRVLLRSPPSPEFFKINPYLYVPEEYGEKVEEVSSSDEESDAETTAAKA